MKFVYLCAIFGVLISCSADHEIQPTNPKSQSAENLARRRTRSNALASTQSDRESSYATENYNTQSAELHLSDFQQTPRGVLVSDPEYSFAWEGLVNYNSAWLFYPNGVAEGQPLELYAFSNNEEYQLAKLKCTLKLTESCTQDGKTVYHCAETGNQCEWTANNGGAILTICID